MVFERPYIEEHLEAAKLAYLFVFRTTDPLDATSPLLNISIAPDQPL